MVTGLKKVVRKNIQLIGGGVFFAMFTLIALFAIEGSPARFATENAQAVFACDAFFVSNASVSSGDSVTLSWDYSDEVVEDENVLVFINGVGDFIGAVGSTTVTPTSNTTYTSSIVSVENNVTITCSVTVLVVDPVCTMVAAPTAIVQGETSTLTWTSENTTHVDIPGVGTNLATSSSAVVSPATTTTYTGTFYGEDDTQITCQATITVTPPIVPAPTCALTANPTQVVLGGSSTLTWTSENTTRVDIPGVGTNLATSSSAVVSPATTTTYTGTFYGEDDTQITCQATITVTLTPEPSCSLSANPTRVSQGGTATLTWSSTLMESAVIDQGIGAVATTGSRSVTVSNNTTYTGTFTDAEGATRTCTANISISTGGGSCINCDSDPKERDRDPDPTIILGKSITRPGSFITLDQIPYTGFEAGPVLTTVFWLAVLLLSAVIAYIVTVVRPVDRIKLTLERRFAGTKNHVVDESPSYIRSAEHTEKYSYQAPVVLQQPKIAVAVASPFGSGSDTATEIEEMAHKEGILLSPEALRMIQSETETSGKSLSEYVTGVFDTVKSSYPREDGWILLSKERCEKLRVQQTHSLVDGSVEEKRDMSVQPNTVQLSTQPQVEATRPFRVEQKQISKTVDTQKNTQPVVQPIASDIDTLITRAAEQKVQVNSSTQAVNSQVNGSPATQNVVATFIETLVQVQKKEAFDLLRNITTRGVDVAVFIGLVVRQLDDVYKQQIEGNRNPNSELVRKTASWTNDDFESVLGSLVECIDYSYSNNRIGTKVALAKIFEHFERKK
jgi:hypothetical protein